MKNNRFSLYLDFYPPVVINGKLSRREFLGLYVSARPKTEAERETNKETRILAEIKRSQRQIELDRNPNALAFSSKKKGDFLEFYRSIVDEKVQSRVNPRSWRASLGHLEAFTNGQCRFADLTADFVEKYRSYLLNCRGFDLRTRKGRYERNENKVKKLSPNSAKIYFSFFVASVKKAYKKKFLTENPVVESQPIDGVKSLREFLTLDELKALAKTECQIPDALRRAALFSALSGLRFSDIEDLTWSNVRENADEPFLVLRIRKTGEAVVHPISPEARELLGKKKDKDAQVFEALKYSPSVNAWIDKWTTAAGIDRRITFHAFRHTFSAIQQNSGTPIETIQEMLGHADLTTTKRYLHSLGLGKRKAANVVSLK